MNKLQQILRLICCLTSEVRFKLVTNARLAATKRLLSFLAARYLSISFPGSLRQEKRPWKRGLAFIHFTKRRSDLHIIWLILWRFEKNISITFLKSYTISADSSLGEVFGTWKVSVSFSVSISISSSYSFPSLDSFRWYFLTESFNKINEGEIWDMWISNVSSTCHNLS